MVKYIFQRVLILVFALSVIFGICGSFIDNFYYKRYDNVKIIKNIECRHYQACNTTDCKDVGRFVKFSYVKNDGSKDVESIFFKYNNEVEKNVISNRYNKLVNEHIGYVNRDWLIALLVLLAFGSGVACLPLCICNMNVKYDYSDSVKEISLFRLKVFCCWKKFIGHPAELMNAFYMENINAINNIMYFGAFKIPYYSELQKEYNKFVINHKE